MLRTVSDPWDTYISIVPIGIAIYGDLSEVWSLVGVSKTGGACQHRVCVKGAALQSYMLHDGYEHAHATTCNVSPARNVVQNAPDASQVQRERGEPCS